ncbi:adenylosuccinate lyase [Heliobacterium gestii]|uniref:Adenylosuccinate lyase n=1 Tax=Heliomicrobium gestii TaxID=2699 RepID=A0A845LH08_HELGE|nr:adenylosuccinate lyase [Heliomicrobium gestii]MBM7867441.1 adenylosuccinate lyase [Heliomicrobium gestii]MZP43705.1 adenylosuccinate lyase [Heliomicrobium gestii]
MIERYTLKDMGAIWADENRFRKWLDVEVAACEALAVLGKIPQEAFEAIRDKADFNVQRILEIEEVTKHDVLAFLTCVAEYVGEESKYIHMGMTSSDVLDTSLSLQMREAGEIILQKLKKLREVIGERAKEHKYTVMVGRTHGIHAEPVTFGLKLALWYDEVNRCIKRMNHAIETISVGAISGAVGTFAQIDPFVEEYACRKLGLRPAPISTQVIQRDRHAEYMTTLAVIGSSLDKFATELRNLQRTDIHEVEEAFSKGQKGSSAMPHKKNPITSERVAGLARVLRGNALAAMENVALWHERDITHSSVERVIVPDSTILLDYMLAKMIDIVANLNVYPETMQENLEKTLGLVNSQRVMLALVDKGALRETAYHWVQRNALKAWEIKRPFKELVLEDSEIMEKLSPAEVEGLFDYDYHIKHVDTLFKRVGL